MTDTQTLPEMPMPVRIDRAGCDTNAEYDIAVLLLEHGVNPHNIPRPKPGALDVFTESGYLRVTGRVTDSNEIETTRMAWPETLPAEVVARVLTVFRGTDPVSEP